MNPYRCETCKKHYLYYDIHPEQKEHCPLLEWLRYQANYSTPIIGCVSHSDFQSEWEKVLDELYQKLHKKSCLVGYVKYGRVIEVSTLESVFAELRQGGKVEKHNQPQPVNEAWQPDEPDYKECPCWISPCDPESTRGNCQADGECKLWHHKPYEKCDRFQKGCENCLDEPLCKFRIATFRQEGKVEK